MKIISKIIFIIAVVVVVVVFVVAVVVVDVAVTLITDHLCGGRWQGRDKAKQKENNRWAGDDY